MRHASKVDKDKTYTWLRYKDSLCEGCRATCCTMPVEIRAEDLLRMELISEDDVLKAPKRILSKLSKLGLVRSYRASTKLFMLEPKSNGDCPFLNSETRLCTLYEKRPDICRKFPYVGLRPGYCPALPKARI